VVEPVKPEQNPCSKAGPRQPKPKIDGALDEPAGDDDLPASDPVRERSRGDRKSPLHHVIRSRLSFFYFPTAFSSRACATR
jgi:hypothetical protein